MDANEKAVPIRFTDSGKVDGDWPEYGAATAALLRSPRVQHETVGIVFYATNSKATYREVSRVEADDADTIRLKLIDVDPTFRANGGPLRDDQVSPGAETPTLRALESEYDGKDPVAVSPLDRDLADSNAVARGATSGGGVAGSNQTVANSDVEAGNRPTQHEAQGGSSPTVEGGDAGGSPQNTEEFDESLALQNQQTNEREESTDTTDTVSGAEQGSGATATTTEDAQRQLTTEHPGEPDTADYPEGYDRETGEVGTATEGAQADEEEHTYEAKHRGHGSYSIVDETGREVYEGMNKTQVDAFNALSPSERRDFVKGVTTPPTETPEDAA